MNISRIDRFLHHYSPFSLSFSREEHEDGGRKQSATKYTISSRNLGRRKRERERRKSPARCTTTSTVTANVERSKYPRFPLPSFHHATLLRDFDGRDIFKIFNFFSLFFKESLRRKFYIFDPFNIRIIILIITIFIPVIYFFMCKERTVAFTLVNR